MRKRIKIIIILCLFLLTFITLAYFFRIKYINSLVIQSKNVIYINKNDDFNILNNIKVVDLNNNEVKDAKVTVKGEVDTSKAGEYTIELTAHSTPFYTGEKEIKVVVKNKSSLKNFIQRIQGYWYYSPDGNSDNFQLFHFQFKEKGCYYGDLDLSWGGYLNFKYINDDSTFATGDIEITQGNRTWKEKFEIDIGTINDGLMHLKLTRKNKVLIDDDVKYVGETASEANRWIHGY